jgi:nucleoside-diphosphate-sugar epimerase
VTGAGGFVGRRLVAELLARQRLAPDRPAITEIVAIDTNAAQASDPRVRSLSGDIADIRFRSEITRAPIDIFFHLAALPAGATAANPSLGWRTNVDALAALLEGLGEMKTPPRFVFSSSIGVFGVPLPRDKVDDATLPIPTLSYGTHKLIGEGVLADCSRRGLVDGIAVRLPGIVARPPAPSGHRSAYMSDIFHAFAKGEPITCPVSPTAASWLMSCARCVDNLIHAAALPAGRIDRRAFNLPALRVTMGELARHLADRFAREMSLVTWAPDPELEAQFGAYPLLETPIASGLGFKDDGDISALVARALDLDKREG